jgi:hypothetical protein
MVLVWQLPVSKVAGSEDYDFHVHTIKRKQTVPKMETMSESTQNSALSNVSRLRTYPNP